VILYVFVTDRLKWNEIFVKFTGARARVCVCVCVFAVTDCQQMSRNPPQKKTRIAVAETHTTDAAVSDAAAPTDKTGSQAVMVGTHFRIGQRIGRGNFGEIRLGTIFIMKYIKHK